MIRSKVLTQKHPHISHQPLKCLPVTEQRDHKPNVHDVKPAVPFGGPFRKSVLRVKPYIGGQPVFRRELGGRDVEAVDGAGKRKVL